MSNEDSATALDRRRADSIIAITEQRSLTDYWAAAVENDKRRGPSGLDARMKAVAAYVPDGSRVVDIGCAGGRLETFLPAGCHYIPVDIHKQDPRTIVVDLNREPLPAIAADVAITLGVLEYIFDVPAFLAQLASRFSKVIATYYPLNLSPTLDRLSSGWYNSLNDIELRAIAAQAGFARIIPHRIGQSLMIYEFYPDA